MKILIIGGEALEKEGLSCMIKEMPLKVSEILYAPRGRKAPGVIRERRPEIITADIRIPAMNGLKQNSF